MTEQQLFGTESTETLSPSAADQICNLLEDEYPKSHPLKMKNQDLSQGYTTASGIFERVRQGSKFITLSSIDPETGGSKLEAFLEGRFIFPFNDDGIRNSGGLYAQVSWLVVAVNSQGQGIAHNLHKKWMEKAREVQADYRIRTAAQLCVHPDNPAHEIYKKWGYKSYKKSDDGRIFMFKDLDQISS